MNDKSSLQARIKNLSLVALAATLTFGAVACSAGPDDAASLEPSYPAPSGEHTASPDSGAPDANAVNIAQGAPSASPAASGGSNGNGDTGSGAGGNGGAADETPHSYTRQ